MSVLKHLCLIFSAIIILGCTTKDISNTDRINKINDFSAIIEKAKGSIVFISTSANESPTINRQQNSLCSGAIINDAGIIITNFHCIYKTKYIQVYYWDENDWSGYDVKVIGEDPLADLALLEPIEKRDKSTPFLTIVDNVSVGEDVFALGHPMGMAWTVTKGIISSTERYARHPFIKAVQTDAAINKGNSGGPLLNMKGEIVAINALIVSRVSENAGVGISIRGDIVKNSIELMSKHGKVDRPAIGVTIMELAGLGSTAELIKEYPDLDKDLIPNTYGLFVRKGDTLPKGIKAFDTIIAVNDTLVNNGVELTDAIAKHKIDDTITLTVIRKRKYIRVEVELRLFPVPIDKLFPRK